MKRYFLKSNARQTDNELGQISSGVHKTPPPKTTRVIMIASSSSSSAIVQEQKKDFRDKNMNLLKRLDEVFSETP